MSPRPGPCSPTCRCAVQNAQVVGPGAAVVGGGAVIPDHHHLLGALEASDGAHMPLSPVLLAPLPVRAPHHSGPDSLHHHPVVPGAAHGGPRSGAAHGGWGWGWGWQWRRRRRRHPRPARESRHNRDFFCAGKSGTSTQSKEGGEGGTAHVRSQPVRLGVAAMFNAGNASHLSDNSYVKRDDSRPSYGGDGGGRL